MMKQVLVVLPIIISFNTAYADSSCTSLGRRVYQRCQARTEQLARQCRRDFGDCKDSCNEAYAGGSSDAENCTAMCVSDFTNCRRYTRNIGRNCAPAANQVVLGCIVNQLIFSSPSCGVGVVIGSNGIEVNLGGLGNISLGSPGISINVGCR